VAEYEECLLKAQFLTREDPPFALIETLRWSPAEGYALLAEHLERLTQSARYFGYPCHAAKTRAVLDAHASHFDAPRRVRLTLSEAGEIDLSDAPLPEASNTPLMAILSEDRVSSRDVFLYHKTTRRDFFERALAQHANVDEVLFHNEEGALTEGTRTNIFLKRGGTYLTPALECGLLAGTLRARLIAEGKAREARLTANDIRTDPDALHLGNSVRGLMKARLL
jgi:para-aminobenzoate synthetase/4-amino-4-deoxychorismate lyase